MVIVIALVTVECARGDKRDLTTEEELSGGFLSASLVPASDDTFNFDTLFSSENNISKSIPIDEVLVVNVAPTDGQFEIDEVASVAFEYRLKEGATSITADLEYESGHISEPVVKSVSKPLTYVHCMYSVSFWLGHELRYCRILAINIARFDVCLYAMHFIHV